MQPVRCESMGGMRFQVRTWLLSLAADCCEIATTHGFWGKDFDLNQERDRPKFVFGLGNYGRGYPMVDEDELNSGNTSHNYVYHNSHELLLQHTLTN